MGERCLVLGGGVMGLMTARLLRLEGYEVTVIERGRAGREASWAAGGILAPLYPWQYPDAVTELFLWSANRFPHFSNILAEESGVDPEWVQSGMLIFDTEEKDEAIQWAQKYNVSVDLLPIEDVMNAEPRIAQVADEALWFPDMAQIRPPRLMKALRASAIRYGIEIREKTEVIEIKTERNRVKGIETKEGPVFADLVMIACGAWSGELLNAMKIDNSIEPVRGQMVLYKAKPTWLSRMVHYRRRYLIPRRDGRILAGSTVEYAGFDKKTTRESIELLRQAALEMMPCLRECRMESRWAGLRPGIKGSLPIISPHPSIHGLYINSGHFRSGMILSLASAQLLVNLIMNEPAILNPKPYLL